MFLSKLFKHFKPEIYVSSVNQPIHIGTSFGKKAIFAGSIPQSGGEFVYEWNTVMKLLKKRGYNLTTCLLLGVAGGDAINALVRYYPTVSIHGIEVDPVILEVALSNKFFRTGDHVSLTTADAIAWVKADTHSYDLIIVDLYLGVKNVKEARESTFLTRVRNKLAEDGVVLYSCHYTDQDKTEYKAFLTLIRSLFSNVEVVFEYPKNKILLFTTSGT